MLGTNIVSISFFHAFFAVWPHDIEYKVCTCTSVLCCMRFIISHYFYFCISQGILTFLGFGVVVFGVVVFGVEDLGVGDS